MNIDKDEIPHISTTLTYISNSSLAELRNLVKDEIKTDVPYKDELNVLLNDVLIEMGNRLYSS